LPETPAPDTTAYPRTYRSWGGGTSLRFWHIVSAGGALLLWSFRLVHSIWIALPVLLYVGLIVASQTLSKFVLYPDRIERVGWTGKRQTMMRQDISSRRSFGKDIFVSFKSGAPPWRISGIRKDPSWDAWMASVPDLDAQNQAVALANPKLGRTPAERSHRWHWGIRLAWLLVATTVLAGIWGPFQTAEYHIPGTVALLSLPWLALLYGWRWGDIMTADYDPERETGGGNLRVGNPILLACATAFVSLLGLLAIAVQRGGLSLVEGSGLEAFGLGLATFVVYTVAYFRATKYARRPMIAFTSGFLVLPIVFSYSWVGVLCLNCLSDSYRNTYISAHVAGKDISTDGHGNPSFNVRLAPWGPNKKETRFHVTDADEFARYEISDIVCVAMHPGFLGIRIWSVGGNCPPV